jgi:hypothetical protein
MNMQLEFKPKVRVGPFIIGSSIKLYHLIPNLVYDSTEERFGSHFYTLLGKDFLINVKNGIIEAIWCKEECIYNERNLIGMTLGQFEKYIDLKFNDFDIESLDWGTNRVYSYEDVIRNINLLVYTKRRRIFQIIIMDLCEDNE